MILSFKGKIKSVELKSLQNQNKNSTRRLLHIKATCVESGKVEDILYYDTDTNTNHQILKKSIGKYISIPYFFHKNGNKATLSVSENFPFTLSDV